MKSETIHFELDDAQWGILSGVVRQLRSDAFRKGVTSQLRRDGKNFSITFTGADFPLMQSVVTFRGMLIQRAPQNEEQRKQSAELAEAMRAMEMQGGPAASSGPTIKKKE